MSAASLIVFGSAQLLHSLRKGFHMDTPHVSADGFTEAHIAYLRQQDELDDESLSFAFGVNSMYSSNSTNGHVSGTFSLSSTHGV